MADLPGPSLPPPRHRRRRKKAGRKAKNLECLVTGVQGRGIDATAWCALHSG